MTDQTTDAPVERRDRWTCFHCSETFTTPGAARDHFGFEPSADPACQIKLGAERGLVTALRKAERDCEELRRLLHDETCEAYRLYAAQTTRHNEQIMAAEEAGYERGLADGRTANEGMVERNLAGHFKWAAPGDRQEDVWLIRFDDNDIRDLVFMGDDAEKEAWKAWNRHSPGYNCRVFRLAQLSDPIPEQKLAETEVKLEVAERALAFGARWFEQYAIEHEVKARKAQDSAEVANRNDKAQRNQERADALRSAIATIRSEQGK